MTAPAGPLRPNTPLHSFIKLVAGRLAELFQEEWRVRELTRSYSDLPPSYYELAERKIATDSEQQHLHKDKALRLYQQTLIPRRVMRQLSRRQFNRVCSLAPVRAAVYRQSQPDVKYWKNHITSLADRVPMEDQRATDWAVFDPRDNQDSPEWDETPA